jgi:hypothetical protein
VQPSIGRIVLYQLAEHDVADINRRRAGRATRERLDRATLGNHAEAGQVFPAIVVRHFGAGTCNLRILLDGTDTHWATSRTEGTTPGTWAWPART